MKTWLCLLLTLALVLGASSAHAHRQGRSYCNVQRVPGGVDVSVETTAEHLVPALGLSSRAPSDQELLAAKDRLLTQLQDRVQARVGSELCRTEAAGVELDRREGERSVVAHLRYFCPAGPVTLRVSWRLDVDPASEVMCSIEGAAWIFRLGMEEREVGAPPTLSSVVWSFVRSGAVHVFLGIDHVLFVLVLLVLAALGAREDTLSRGLRHMVKVVTGFTLGHSITLIAAGLDVVRVDSRWTESIIALSIVAVGVENVVRRDPRFRGLTATAFGLVHGFGFASVLAETELPRRGAVWALLSFNVGIELAQLAIVAVCFPLLALAAKKAWYERVVLVPVSLFVAVLATLWFVKRAFALEFLPWLGG